MLSFKSQVLVTLAVLVGLFFLEYPPLFALGYWSWGATVHKTTTGAFLIINLVAAQLVARRLGFFRDGSSSATKETQKSLPRT